MATATATAMTTAGETPTPATTSTTTTTTNAAMTTTTESNPASTTNTTTTAAPTPAPETTTTTTTTAAAPAAPAPAPAPAPAVAADSVTTAPAEASDPSAPATTTDLVVISQNLLPSLRQSLSNGKLTEYYNKLCTSDARLLANIQPFTFDVRPRRASEPRVTETAKFYVDGLERQNAPLAKSLDKCVAFRCCSCVHTSIDERARSHYTPGAAQFYGQTVKAHNVFSLMERLREHMIKCVFVNANIKSQILVYIQEEAKIKEHQQGKALMDEQRVKNMKVCNDMLQNFFHEWLATNVRQSEKTSLSLAAYHMLQRNLHRPKQQVQQQVQHVQQQVRHNAAQQQHIQQQIQHRAAANSRVQHQVQQNAAQQQHIQQQIQQKGPYPMPPTAARPPYMNPQMQQPLMPRYGMPPGHMPPPHMQHGHIPPPHMSHAHGPPPIAPAPPKILPAATKNNPKIYAIQQQIQEAQQLLNQVQQLKQFQQQKNTPNNVGGIEQQLQQQVLRISHTWQQQQQQKQQKQQPEKLAILQQQLQQVQLQAQHVQQQLLNVQGQYNTKQQQVTLEEMLLKTIVVPPASEEELCQELTRSIAKGLACNGYALATSKPMTIVSDLTQLPKSMNVVESTYLEMLLQCFELAQHRRVVFHDDGNTSQNDKTHNHDKTDTNNNHNNENSNVKSNKDSDKTTEENTTKKNKSTTTYHIYIQCRFCNSTSSENTFCVNSGTPEQAAAFLLSSNNHEEGVGGSCHGGSHHLLKTCNNIPIEIKNKLLRYKEEEEEENKKSKVVLDTSLFTSINNIPQKPSNQYYSENYYYNKNIQDIQLHFQEWKTWLSHMYGIPTVNENGSTTYNTSNDTTNTSSTLGKVKDFELYVPLTMDKMIKIINQSPKHLDQVKEQQQIQQEEQIQKQIHRQKQQNENKQQLQEQILQKQKNGDILSSLLIFHPNDVIDGYDDYFDYNGNLTNAQQKGNKYFRELIQENRSLYTSEKQKEVIANLIRDEIRNRGGNFYRIVTTKYDSINNTNKNLKVYYHRKVALTNDEIFKFVSRFLNNSGGAFSYLLGRPKICNLNTTNKKVTTLTPIIMSSLTTPADSITDNNNNSHDNDDDLNNHDTTNNNNHVNMRTKKRKRIAMEGIGGGIVGKSNEVDAVVIGEIDQYDTSPGSLVLDYETAPQQIGLLYGQLKWKGSSNDNKAFRRFPVRTANNNSNNRSRTAPAPKNANANLPAVDVSIENSTANSFINNNTNGIKSINPTNKGIDVIDLS